MEAYRLIVTMEEGQQEALRVEFPAVADRIQLLSQLGRGIAYDVADPIGYPIGAYRTAAREIKQLLQLAQPQIVQYAQTQKM